ncbi:class I SAM-dependent methyltransferase, partial [Candidatus Pelagibacter sp.]|nr:class I SAM-dependent methyltransferase [Candidatus Pelagibacter sp.]
AIKNKNKFNIKLNKSTADKLPYRKSFFDVIIYGFCLYLVDDLDLIKTVLEADRVTKRKSLIIIYDFYAKNTVYKKFKHKKNIFVRKMDYSKIFSWLPYYEVLSLKKIPYLNKKSDLVSLICIRKK